MVLPSGLATKILVSLIILLIALFVYALSLLRLNHKLYKPEFNIDEFLSKHGNKFMIMATNESIKSDCLNKNWGAIIVDQKGKIISTGHNAVPHGRETCLTLFGSCWRTEQHIKRGTNYDRCRSVHAEQDAINHANPKRLKGSIMFLYGFDVLEQKSVFKPSPCPMCKRSIINAGIKYVIIENPDFSYTARDVNDYIEHDDTALHNSIVGY